MPYNLSEAFEAIEDELISSMMRNLKRHQAEETDLGFEWEQWQALQLKALEDYRRRNLKKFPPRFNKLNLQIDEMLRASYKDGRTAQERKILKAIRKGFKAPLQPFSGVAEIEGSFFGVNDRKLDALLNAVNNDMNRAEYAVLRRADDQYRQVIFNAQVYANTGAGTYKKAVDMATRDFLRAGLDCVEYKDGSRHTLEDYADMAIKTANKRAYLQGEGSMREEWGVPTVIMNKRNCPCPRCLPFVGKVFIDDVWSGADKSGISPVTGLKYPLMSEAIAKGLYHPRCKDVHSTYFEGISTPPEGSQYTADELDEMAQQYEAEQKQGYYERQEKRYDRISKYSLDEDNQRIYGARAKAYGEKAEQFGKVAKAFEKQPEYLRNNLPKGYKDTRNIGNPISKEDLSDIMNYAAENGVQIGTTDNITGGFEHYCGDKDVLYSMIDELKRQQESSLFKNSKADKMILKYDNVLGYKNDNSKIDIGAFAVTKGRTITLNKFMFDDTQYLKKEYEEAVKEGFFVKDSTIDNIIAHEVGHVIDHKTKGLYQKVFKSLVNQSNLKGVSIDEYLVENISIYASDLAKDDKYHELLAEINSLLKTNPESGIIKIIKSEEVIL